MPAANLDLVRSIYAAWERGNFGSSEWASSEIEFAFTDGPEPGSYKGQGAMAKAMRDWLSAWEDLRQEPEEYRELDRERVMVLHRFSASGKTSGLDLGEIEAEGAALFYVHSGKVTRIVHYYDRQRALADLGLTPDTGT
jgi:ketosteroid isomerase-like protein